jgi:hypothetical protein
VVVCESRWPVKVKGTLAGAIAAAGYENNFACCITSSYPANPYPPTPISTEQNISPGGNRSPGRILLYYRL